jgi:hypothetical protein
VLVAAVRDVAGAPDRARAAGAFAVVLGLVGFLRAPVADFFFALAAFACATDTRFVAERAIFARADFVFAMRAR